ncbi:hypothetical protein HY989_05560 [Candidatus Micrarchaeota archaeon]|nr:hypothetical protein [Candidatus Micrarchaeota archaeon]
MNDWDFGARSGDLVFLEEKGFEAIIGHCSLDWGFEVLEAEHKAFKV